MRNDLTTNDGTAPVLSRLRAGMCVFITLSDFDSNEVSYLVGIWILILYKLYHTVIGCL